MAVSIATGGAAKLIGEIRTAARQTPGDGVCKRKELDRRLLHVEALVLEVIHPEPIGRTDRGF